MLAAAIEAGTPEATSAPPPGTAAFGRAGSVVLGEVLGARALTGGVGGLGALGGFSAGWLSFGSTKTGDTTMRSFYAEPAIDAFVTEGFSVGAVLGGGLTSLSSDLPSNNFDVWHATVMPRIGEAFALTDAVTLWPRLAAGASFFDSAGQQKVGTALRITFDAPFVFSLAKHVALQAGPVVSYVSYLSGPVDSKGFYGGVSGGLSVVF